MNPLKPLLFLTYKTTFNGLKRAVTTPKRLLYFVFFVFYYFYFINRLAFGVGNTHVDMPQQLVGKIPFPPLEVLDAVVFGLFTLGYMFMLIALTSYQGTVRPADVDVLFPTPIPPKTVLAFRIARDYFFTLITPLFIALMGMRASKMGWEAIFRNMPHPEYSGIAMRTLMISWILMAFCFVAVVHSVGLYTNRSDRHSDRNRKLLSWIIGAYVLGFVAFLVAWFRFNPGVSSLFSLAESPTMRTIFFLPMFATELTMAPFTGNALPGILGAAGMVLIIIFGLNAAFKQIGWYYDLAATKGNTLSKQRNLMRSGDQSGLMAERARSGKYRVRRFNRIYNLNMSGPKALIWKELILQPRTILPILILLILFQVVISGICAWTVDALSSRAVQMGGFMLLTMQAMMTLTLSMVISQTGFLEVLRRVDLQKALPFTPATIVRNEILGRSFVAIGSAWIGSLLFLCLNTKLWQFALAAILLAPAETLLLMASSFFVTILFPDVDDQTQRQFRGLMMLLGIVITGFFPAAIFIVLTVLKVSPAVGALASFLCAAAITVAVTAIAGGIYAGYNPSE